VRESVKLFSYDMENKLKQNEHKGGWDEESINDLYHMLIRETIELDEAIKDHLCGISFEDDVVSECADVANFAMMIADRLKYRTNRRGREL